MRIKTYLSIAVPVGFMLHTIICGMVTADPINGPPVPFTWANPGSAAFVACGIAAIGGWLSHLRDEDSRRAIEWHGLSAAEKDVILEIRKKVQT